MFRAAEGVFHHIPSFRWKQSRERFHQRYYQSFPCFANPLISISAGAAGGDWRGRRGGDAGAAGPQATGGILSLPPLPLDCSASVLCFQQHCPDLPWEGGAALGASWICPGLDVPAQLFQQQGGP